MRACVDGFRPVEQFFVVIAEVPLNCRILVSFFVKNTSPVGITSQQSFMNKTSLFLVCEMKLTG